MSDDTDSPESKNHPAGAREKIRRAKMLRDGVDPGIVHGKREDDGKSLDVIPSLVAIYGMAVSLALLLTQGALSKGTLFHLPDPTLDLWLLGSPVPAVTGNSDTDMLIAVFVRGMAIFLLAGIVPFLTKAVYGIFCGRQEAKPPYTFFWMVSVVLCTLAYASYR